MINQIIILKHYIFSIMINQIIILKHYIFIRIMAQKDINIISYRFIWSSPLLYLTVGKTGEQHLFKISAIDKRMDRHCHQLLCT